MEPLKVLVACEYSGVVTNAFNALGHNAMSCDLEPAEGGQPHYHGNVFDILDEPWDLMVAHPPCTFLCSSGARWKYDPRYPTRAQDQDEAAEFFMRLFDANIPKVAVENPIGVMSTRFRKPNQIIQPYQFGDPFRKATCLWLKGLPNLVPTNVLPEGQREQAVWKMAPSADRGKKRSLTYQGFGDAMAMQWGGPVG